MSKEIIENILDSHNGSGKVVATKEKNMKWYVVEDQKGNYSAVSEEEYKYTIFSENVVVMRSNDDKDIIAICPNKERADLVMGCLNDKVC